MYPWQKSVRRCRYKILAACRTSARSTPSCSAISASARPSSSASTERMRRISAQSGLTRRSSSCSCRGRRCGPSRTPGARTRCAALLRRPAPGGHGEGEPLRTTGSGERSTTKCARTPARKGSPRRSGSGACAVSVVRWQRTRALGTGAGLLRWRARSSGGYSGDRVAALSSSRGV
jgi:hypothetical protein